jgi:putative adhesin Stv-like protein
MATVQTALGESFYVFSLNPQGWSGQGHCVIDCHGRPATLKPYFTVGAGIEINFYVSKGAFLMADVQHTDTGINFVDAVLEIQGGRAKPVETKTAGQKCPNYVLSKQHTSVSGSKWFRYKGMGYDDIKACMDAFPAATNAVDVITVRNRTFAGDPTLYDFLEAAKKNAFQYTTIDCCFCRGGVWDMVKDVFGHGKNELPGGAKYHG